MILYSDNGFKFSRTIKKDSLLSELVKRCVKMLEPFQYLMVYFLIIPFGKRGFCHETLREVKVTWIILTFSGSVGAVETKGKIKLIMVKIIIGS